MIKWLNIEVKGSKENIIINNWEVILASSVCTSLRLYKFLMKIYFFLYRFNDWAWLFFNEGTIQERDTSTIAVLWNGC